MNLTISEIARIAQVSKGTVSKALNNYPGINEQTRQRILDLVKEMGYEPNAAAQALAFRRTGNIGLIIPHTPEHSLDGAYWSSMVTSIAQEVVINGYRLSLMLPQEEGRLDELLRSIKRRQQYDGLVVGCELVDEEELSILDDEAIPFVMLGRDPDHPRHSVDVDNVDAGWQITNHMIRQGYRRIAYVSGPLDYSYNKDRVNGYRRALSEAGIQATCHLPVPYNDTMTLIQRMEEMFREFRPDAVIAGAGGDFMFDCLNTLLSRGLKIPQTGFATFDDYRYLDFTQPPITAVQQPVRQIGSQAVHMLLDLIDHPDQTGEPQCCLMKASLRVRGSCGPVRHNPA